MQEIDGSDIDMVVNNGPPTVVETITYLCWGKIKPKKSHSVKILDKKAWILKIYNKMSRKVENVVLFDDGKSTS